MSVTTAPELLCVTIKRFTHHASRQYQSKINKHVEFPVQLDLLPFMAQAQPPSVQYDLSAVICHHGGLAHGHYVAYTCDATTGQWHCFDDASVTLVSWEEVRQAQAYCLFYKSFCRVFLVLLMRDFLF
jgi:ubiquitin C-terminal hydrolase